MSSLYPTSAATLPYDTANRQGSPRVRPAWALLGVVAGAVFAVLLVPDGGHYVPGALMPAGLALGVGLMFGPILSGMRDPGTAFRAEHVLMFGLLYWILIDVIQGSVSYRLWDVSPETVQLAFFYTGLFAAFLWIGSALASLMVSGPPVPRSGPDLGVRFLFVAGLACFVLGFAQAALTCRLSVGCVVDALFRPRFEVPWFSGPGIKGLNQVLLHLKYFGYLIPAILVALVSLERRISWRSVVLFPLAIAFMLLLLRDGGRKELGTVIGAALLTWILLRPRRELRHYAFVVAAVAGLLMLMQVMVTWREVGVTRAFGGDQPAPKVYRRLAIDWSFDWMAHAIEVVPQRAPHVGWNGIVYVLGYPIPRSVWPSKPPLHGIDLPRHIGREYGPRFSWNCSTVCDLYLIGGSPAVAIGGILYGFLANLASRLLFQPPSVRSRLLYAVVAMVLFLALRTLIEFMVQGITVAALLGLFMFGSMLSRPRRIQA